MGIPRTKIGSPTYLLIDAPLSAWNQSYDPDGTERLNSGGTGTGYSQNPYSFKGGIQDRASDLVKFGQRWYHPATGTWTQQDTLDAPLDPKNANRYQYAGGDPINGADPTGRFFQLSPCNASHAQAGGLLLTRYATYCGIAGSAAAEPFTFGASTIGLIGSVAGLAATYANQSAVVNSVVANCGPVQGITIAYGLEAAS